MVILIVLLPPDTLQAVYDFGNFLYVMGTVFRDGKNSLQPVRQVTGSFVEITEPW